MVQRALSLVEQIALDDKNEMLVDDYLQAADDMEAAFSGQFNRWVLERIDALGECDRDSWQPELIRAIDGLDMPIWTTNYDHLIEMICQRGSQGRGPGERGIDVTNRAIRDVLHLHGHRGDPQSIVLGAGSYASLLADAQQRDWMQLTLSRPLLFIGCGETLGDPNFAAVRRVLRDHAPANRSVVAFRLSKQDEVEGHRTFHRNEGDPIDVVCYGSKHADLPAYVQWLAGQVPKATVPVAVAATNVEPARIITAVIDANEITLTGADLEEPLTSDVPPDSARQVTIAQLKAQLVTDSDDAEGSPSRNEEAIRLLGSHLLMYFGPLLARTLQAHVPENCGLVLDIRDPAHELLPWECMYSKPTPYAQSREPKEGLLANTLKFSIVRKAKQAAACRDRRKSDKLNVFVVAADPGDLLKASTISQLLREVPEAVALTPDPEREPMDATRDGIAMAYIGTNRALASYDRARVDVVHIVASAAMLPGQPGGIGIALVDPDDPDQLVGVRGGDLASQFEEPPPRLIVLHLSTADLRSGVGGVFDDHALLIKLGESVSALGAATNVMVLPFRKLDRGGNAYVKELYRLLAGGERLDVALRAVPRELRGRGELAAWNEARGAGGWYGFPVAYVGDPDAMAAPDRAGQHEATDAGPAPWSSGTTAASQAPTLSTRHRGRQSNNAVFGPGDATRFPLGKERPR